MFKVFATVFQQIMFSGAKAEENRILAISKIVLILMSRMVDS
jgi:hypothetical protein